MTVKCIALAAFVALAACSTATQTGQTVSDACLSADTMLKAAITLDAAGKLTVVQESAVTVAATTINGVCSASAPPTDIASALTAINAAIAGLAAIPGVSK